MTVAFLFRVGLLCAAVFAASIGLGLLLKRGGDLTFRQLHHGYIGAVLLLVGWMLGVLGLAIAGLVLTFDDAEEHLTQLVTGNLTYQSPLHCLWYATLGNRWPFTAFNRWLDQRMH